MMILGAKRLKLINGLGISKALKALTNGEHVHEELEFACRGLSYSLESEDFSPAGLDFVPLWESDLSITGFFIDKHSDPIFIHYYVEDIESYKIIGKTVEELVNFIVEEYVDCGFENEVKHLLLKQ